MTSRRQFTLGLCALPLLLRARGPAHAGGDWCRAVPVAGAGEPGVPLLLIGTVFAADGRTPLAGYRLHVYHTDADGLYSKPDNDARRARLRGVVVTDAQGRYALRTILPG